MHLKIYNPAKLIIRISKSKIKAAHRHTQQLLILWRLISLYTNTEMHPGTMNNKKKIKKLNTIILPPLCS
jgi:hypothetical protein